MRASPETEERGSQNLTRTASRNGHRVTRRENILALLAASFIGVYFLSLTREALHAYFALDDSGNLFRAWYFPLPSLVRANLLFFLTSPFNRPMGSAWYRSIFFFAGYNPVPFHVANLIILLANVWLTYAVARRLSGSREAGALAALLIAYHPRFAYLYFDTAYIYDVLCYFFYFSTLLFYIRARQKMRALRAWEIAACSALFVSALNSKQMAVTLPVCLSAYELLYEKVPLRSARWMLRWFVQDGRFILFSALMTLAFVIGQSFGPESYLQNKAYQPVFTAARFMQTSRNFVSDVLLQRGTLSFLAVMVLWIALFALAWLTGSRPLKFAWLFPMFSVLPVAFIDRGAPQYYISLFGWVFYAAVALPHGTRRIVNLVARNARPPLFQFRGPALFIGLGALMYAGYHGTAWATVPFVSLEGEMIRNVADQMRIAHPTVRRGSRLLFIDDPMGANDYDLMFLARMVYRDPTLVVQRTKLDRAPDPKLAAAYDYVYDYRFGRFFDSIQSRPQTPQPAIAVDWGQFGIYHQGWERVTETNPAKRGETVIAMVTDLGDTLPTVPRGQPFPKEPLLQVAAPVEVRVAGKPAQVVIKIGWPEQVNRYRVDFQVPDVTSGQQPVVISTNTAVGPPVDIPVR